MKILAIILLALSLFSPYIKSTYDNYSKSSGPKFARFDCIAVIDEFGNKKFAEFILQVGKHSYLTTFILDLETDRPYVTDYRSADKFSFVDEAFTKFECPKTIYYR